MHSPIFLHEVNNGIFGEIDFKFSKKVFVASPDGIYNNSFSTLNFEESFLIVDHSDDPTNQSVFDEFIFSKLNIDANKVIIVSPSPDQLFYRDSVSKFKHIFCNGHFAKIKNRLSKRFDLVSQKSIKKLFLCLSREDKLHRRLVNYCLHKNKLFEKGLISHQRTEGGHGFNLADDLRFFSHRVDFDPTFYMQYGLRKHFIDKVTDSSKILGKSLAAYNFEAYANLNKEILIDLPVESYVSDYIFITEKLLKPLVFKTPFLLIGCPLTLKYLRHLGFETFDCVFDESYDEELVLYDRVQGVISNLSQLSTLSLQDATKKFRITEDICNHNYNHFMNSDWSFNLQEKIERAINVS